MKQVENGSVRPTERATGPRRSSGASSSLRRGRRRTLFSSRDPSRTAFRSGHGRNPAPETEQVDDRSPSTDLALAEFVIDDDEYPEVTVDRHPAALADVAEPDRVEDIDQWLEEFAVEDCCCDSLPG